MAAPWVLVVGRAHLYFGTWRVVVVGSDGFVPIGASSARMSILVETCSWYFAVFKSKSRVHVTCRASISRNRVRVGVGLHHINQPNQMLLQHAVCMFVQKLGSHTIWLTSFYLWLRYAISGCYIAI
jgi:hypothetical protein